jgi:hypothetical protein
MVAGAAGRVEAAVSFTGYGGGWRNLDSSAGTAAAPAMVKMAVRPWRPYCTRAEAKGSCHMLCGSNSGRRVIKLLDRPRRGYLDAIIEKPQFQRSPGIESYEIELLSEHVKEKKGEHVVWASIYGPQPRLFQALSNSSP